VAQGAGGEEEKAGEDGGREEESSLEAALKEKRQGLKPTQTIERRHPVVGTGGGGGGRGGGSHAIDDEEEKREFFDTPEQLSRKVEQALQWIRSSNHIIVFTGAGISTSCGIPDFRSGMNTVLETGPGVWELRAHDKAPLKTSHTVPLIKALPSPTHMSIMKLHEVGVVKFTVSQNVDGLHRRSGLAPAELSELHGNTNLETCRKCSRQYLRDFETREALHVFDHTTSRQCDDPQCRGELDDSIINFGENLPEGELKKAFIHAKMADLCIVLGSSLRVSPANQVPEIVLARGGRVVLCNLQKIPHISAGNKVLPVFCKCDEFMEALMTQLGVEIPEFVLHRRVQVHMEEREGEEGARVTVTGLDVKENVPYSFIKVGPRYMYIEGVHCIMQTYRHSPLSMMTTPTPSQRSHSLSPSLPPSPPPPPPLSPSPSPSTVTMGSPH
jgi:NAD-dependent SIR2 family protein deacetylase